jgi:hypothetical protein
MAAIYSNGGNRWNILGFNFTKRDALSSVYKISMYILAPVHISQASLPCQNRNSYHMSQSWAFLANQDTEDKPG